MLDVLVIRHFYSIFLELAKNAMHRRRQVKVSDYYFVKLSFLLHLSINDVVEATTIRHGQTVYIVIGDVLVDQTFLQHFDWRRSC